jgi:Zn-dependent protease with chaperone function
MNEELTAKCACSHCGTHLEFPISADGLTVNCPHCQQPTELSLAAPPAPSGQISAAELLAAFDGTVRRTSTSFFYQVGLLLVSVVMVLLPLVYLGFIVAAGWGLYFFATHCASLLTPMRGGGRIYIVQLFLYIAPLFMGVVLLFFMVKPLFAGRPRHAQPLALNPGVESTLYAFIAKICDLVGAPMPSRIDLDCDLNASARFRRGAASFFGNDLVLTIGLPLVGNLNLREFAGVVAHEFGHFTQGFGMRLSYVIRSVNGWFARVVYERDAWDVWLANLSEDGADWRIMLLALGTRLAVGFSRFLLLLLMMFGHGVSCFLLRQMEYDADGYAIQVAGSAGVESTARRLAVLGEALGRAYKQMRATWKFNKGLPDHFPDFLALHEASLAPVLREKIQDTMGLAKTGVFDTHPSDGDRIRRARQAEEPGVFHLELPASLLFSNFEVAARQVTQLHYADDLGIRFDAKTLRPVITFCTGPAKAK